MLRRWIGFGLAVTALAASTLIGGTAAHAAAGLTFLFRNELGSGGVNIQMGYGPAEALRPVVGDWNGDGRAEIGVTWAANGGRTWSLATGLASAGAAERFRMSWGSDSEHCVPIAGDHDGVGAHSIGMACPDAAKRKWKWTFSTGLSNAGAGAVSYWFGPTHCKPFTGDWDGDGRHGVGVYCVTGDGGLYALANNPSLVSEPNPSAQFRWGPQNMNCVPVSGDWDGPDAGGRSEKVGLACPTAPSNGWNWKLNNWNNDGGVWREFNFGSRADHPLVGDWDGNGTPGIGMVRGIVKPGDPLRREIADLARSQVGVRETGNDCNPYGPICADWCAMFATWVWEQAGVPGVPRGEYVARGLGYWGLQRGLFRYRSQGATPKVGDWVIYGPPDDNTPGHVDVVVAVNSGASVTVVGGNVGQQVTLRTINPATQIANGHHVSGYVSPPGADD